MYYLVQEKLFQDQTFTGGEYFGGSILAVRRIADLNVLGHF